MTSYLHKAQISESLQLIIKQAIEECKESNEVPQDLKEIILHNFNAKFVHLNCEEKTLEVGVEKEDALSLYPKLVTYTYSLDKTSWLKESIKESENDLEFYGRIIARNRGMDENTRVILY